MSNLLSDPDLIRGLIQKLTESINAIAKSQVSQKFRARQLSSIADGSARLVIDDADDALFECCASSEVHSRCTRGLADTAASAVQRDRVHINKLTECREFLRTLRRQKVVEMSRHDNLKHRKSLDLIVELLHPHNQPIENQKAIPDYMKVVYMVGIMQDFGYNDDEISKIFKGERNGNS